MQTITTREQALELALSAIVIETMDYPPRQRYSSDSYLPPFFIDQAMEAINRARSHATAITSPRLGQPWPEQGGIYAGSIRGENGAPDYHLIHATQEHEIIGINWANAKTETGSDAINGFNDWSLPDRREARLLTINSPDSFDKDGWYWTSAQFADNPAYAWVQNFSDGSQSNTHESNEYRARAVRRLIIQ